MGTLSGVKNMILIYFYCTKVFLCGLIIPDRDILRFVRDILQVVKMLSGTFATFDLKYTKEILKNAKETGYISF